MIANDISSTPRQQSRIIGARMAGAIVAASMLGVGIFVAPPIVAENASSIWVYLALWVLGAIVALAGCMSYAELSVRIPNTGGDYAFHKYAFGQSAAFATGWMLFIGVFCPVVASLSVAASDYLWDAIGHGVGEYPSLASSAGVVHSRMLPLSLIAMVTLINMCGIRIAGRIQFVFTSAPIALLFLMSVLGCVLNRSAVEVVPTMPAPLTSLGICRAYLAVYFAYAGWNALCYFAGEMRDPEYSVPKAMLGGVSVVCMLYLALASLFVVVLGPARLGRAINAGSATAFVIAGARASQLVSGLIALSVIAALQATSFSGARVIFAMARDGAFFRAFASPKATSASTATYICQAAISAVIAISGTIQAIMLTASVSMVIMGSLTVVSLFLIRPRSQESTKSYRCPLYPLPPLFFIVANLGVIVVLSVNMLSSTSMSVSRLLPALGVLIYVVAFLTHRLYFHLGVTHIDETQS